MQPSQFPLPFDALGNLILSGIHAPDGSWSIDAAGHLVVHDITLNAGPNETAILIHGEDIDPPLYNHKARGVLEWVDLNGSGPVTTVTTDTLAGRIKLSGFDANRIYRFHGLMHINVNATTPTYVGLRVRYKWDADPAVTDTILFEHQWGGRAATSTDQFAPIDFTFDASDLSAPGTNLHMMINTFSSVAGINIQAETWNYIAISDVGEDIVKTAYDMSTGGGGGVSTYTKTYNATSSAAFQSDGTNRDPLNAGRIYQGFYDSTNGNQFSLIGFDFATIQADLTGSTIVKTELYLKNSHWYNNSGGTVVVGQHNQSSVSGNHAYSQVTDNINQFPDWTVGQAKWVTINNSIATSFKANLAKGIALGKGQSVGGVLSNSHTYYGYFAGATQIGKPQLRITYTK